MKKLSLLMICLLLALCGCADKGAQKNIFLMDTAISIQAYGEGSEDALAEAERVVTELDERLSVTRQTSEVALLNKNGVLSSPSGDLLQILSTAEDVQRSSNGAFNIFIYPMVRAWGFTTDKNRVPDEDELSSLLKDLETASLTYTPDGGIALSPGAQIDLGGIAKGYASYAAAQAIKDAGVSSALLDFGGNICAVGSKPDGTPWHIGVRDPLSDYTVATVAARNTALVTSGGYQRYFEEEGVRYHHIIDPKTGHPSDSDLLSVTIVCTDPTLADALSTALFVLGEDAAVDYWRNNSGTPFDMVLVTKDARVVITQGLSERVFDTGAPGYTYEYVDM